MKKILLLAAFAAMVGVQVASAADLKISKDGAEVLKVLEVKRIVVGEAGITVEGKTSKSLGYDEFNSMAFAKSDIENSVADLQGGSFSFDGAVVRLASVGNVTVYNAAGAVCCKGVAVESLSIADLSKGVYLVEVADAQGRSVAKIMKK